MQDINVYMQDNHVYMQDNYNHNIFSHKSKFM